MPPSDSSNIESGARHLRSAWKHALRMTAETLVECEWSVSTRAVGWNRLLGVQNKRQLSTGFLDCLWSVKFDQSQRIIDKDNTKIVKPCTNVRRRCFCLILYKITAHFCWILISNNRTNINTKQVLFSGKNSNLIGILKLSQALLQKITTFHYSYCSLERELQD